MANTIRNKSGKYYVEVTGSDAVTNVELNKIIPKGIKLHLEKNVRIDIDINAFLKFLKSEYTRTGSNSLRLVVEDNNFKIRKDLYVDREKEAIIFAKKSQIKALKK